MPDYDLNAIQHLWQDHFWLMMLTVLGNILWIVAYITIVHKSFVQKTYGVPIIAVALNFSWELIFSFIFRAPVLLWWLSAIAWAVIDAVIVYQVIRYGRHQQRQPEIRKHFFLVLIGLAIWAFPLMYFFVVFFNDKIGFVSAYLINMVMSFLFIVMLFDRPKLEGLSIIAGISKGVGTGVISLAGAFLLPILYPTVESWAFMNFVGAATFLLDGAYIYLLIERSLKLRKTSTGLATESS